MKNIDSHLSAETPDLAPLPHSGGPELMWTNHDTMIDIETSYHESPVSNHDLPFAPASRIPLLHPSINTWQDFDVSKLTIALFLGDERPTRWQHRREVQQEFEST